MNTWTNMLDVMSRAVEQVERDVTALINATLEGCPSALDERPWWTDFPGYCDQPVTTTVYFIKRTDNSVYATKTNRYLPGEVVLEVMTGSTNPHWSIQWSPLVADYIAELQRRVNKNGTRHYRA